MATWFIWLGRKGVDNYEMYQELATKHNLLQIGYGIEENITKRNKDSIKQYLANDSSLNAYQIGMRASLINKFINEMNIDDIVISPIEPNTYRLGKITENCNTIDSFLSEDELKKIKIKYSTVPEAKHIGIKPARRVNWIYKKIASNDLPNHLQFLLSKNMRATIYRLNGVPDFTKPTKEKILASAYYMLSAYWKFAINEIVPAIWWLVGKLAQYSKLVLSVIVPAAVSSIVSFFLSKNYEKIVSVFESIYPTIKIFLPFL